MTRFNILSVIITLLLFSAVALWPTVKTGHSGDMGNRSLLNEEHLGDGVPAILPLPRALDLPQRKVALGKRLFGDPALSGNGFSCSTCHSLDSFGTDGLRYSIKTGGGFDVMNTPTVFNSGFNAYQLWDGKQDSLEAQLDGVINNPLHMDSSWQLVISRLSQEPEYRRAFDAIYPQGITRITVADAIATYERSLITPDSPFDRYLRGEQDTISQRQVKGYQLFQQYGCVSCHQGINLGGNLFARFGVFEDGLAEREKLNQFDYGRFNYTNDSRDKFVFRVPGLRNVAKTAPYFHDGSAETLDKAIRRMARIQLNVELPDEDVLLIEEFLDSLTGIPSDTPA